MNSFRKEALSVTKVYSRLDARQLLSSHCLNLKIVLPHAHAHVHVAVILSSEVQTQY